MLVPEGAADMDGMIELSAGGSFRGTPLPLDDFDFDLLDFFV